EPGVSRSRGMRATTSQQIRAAIRALDSEGERAPLAAVMRVKRFGSKAVTALIAAMEESSSIRLRRWAATALGAIADRKSKPMLRRALRDPNMSVRLHAMEALEQFQDPALGAALIP